MRVLDHPIYQAMHELALAFDIAPRPYNSISRSLKIGIQYLEGNQSSRYWQIDLWLARCSLDDFLIELNKPNGGNLQQIRQLGRKGIAELQRAFLRQDAYPILNRIQNRSLLFPPEYGYA